MVLKFCQKSVFSSDMTNLFYSSGQVARELGASQSRIRALCESALIKATCTPGGQWRVSHDEVQRLKREGLPALARPLPDPVQTLAHSGHQARGGNRMLLAEPSERVIDAAEEVVCLENEVKAISLRRQMEEELDWFREREEQEDGRRIAQEEAAQERQAEADRERERQAWEVKWINFALDAIPPIAASSQNRVNVYQVVQQTLGTLQPWQPDRIVGEIIVGAVEKALASWERHQEEQKAIESASLSLPLEIRRRSEFAEAKQLALEAARAAIAKLSEGTPYSELEAAAVLAVKPIVVAYEHCQACEKIMSSTHLVGATSVESDEAREAVRRAMGALDIGVSVNELRKAQETALAPYRAKIAQREQAARASLVERFNETNVELGVDLQLQYIDTYLESEYDYADGYNGLVERRKDVERLRPIVRKTLIRECMANPEMNVENVYRRIEKLVDENI